MFRSKIAASARAVEASITFVREVERLTDHPGRLLVVDLGETGAVEAAVAWKTRFSGPVIGFASHVDTATIARARDAGFDRVLARSGFVAELESILRVEGS